MHKELGSKLHLEYQTYHNTYLNSRLHLNIIILEVKIVSNGCICFTSEQLHNVLVAKNNKTIIILQNKRINTKAKKYETRP